MRARRAAPKPRRRRIHEVEVALGARAYKILIGEGLIAGAGEYIARLAPGANCAVVTDSNVAGLHLEALSASLARAGLRSSSIVVPPGEASKSYARFAEVCDGLLAAHIERRDLVVALGGGVIGDLTGFAAASVRRGLRLVQIPTTLLAQVDSSVGGKTAINSPHGKNLVGAFHQPSLVLADIGALDTLSAREFRAGYAETVKYGLIGDIAFFEWLEAHWRDVYAGGEARLRAVATSCAAKAAVVAADETEQGERALLNLGHTFGHAFERLTGYDGARLVHGEAVAIGMACAFRFSRALGYCNGQEAMRVENHLRAVGLPTHIHEIPGLEAEPEAILAAMRQDKKVDRGRLTFDRLLERRRPPAGRAWPTGWPARRWARGRPVLGRRPDRRRLRRPRGRDGARDGAGREMATGVPVGGGVQPTNLACAVAVALHLGVPAEVLADRIASLPPVPNRLTSAQAPSGVLVIDDTFNSNPAGARAALRPAGRGAGQSPPGSGDAGHGRAGPRQAPENQALRQPPPAVATDFVVVGRTNRRALLRGAAPLRPVVVRTREEAVTWVRTHLGPDDAVLYENDLPDNYP